MCISWLLVVALAADDGFAPVKEAVGCAISMRSEEHVNGAAMRASCHWPEVNPGSLTALIDDLSTYDELIWPIEVSEVRRIEGSRRLVYQRQHIWGLTDREVLLWVTREPVEGGMRVAWEAASEEPLAEDPKAIRTPKNTGAWTIERHVKGGAAVTHEIAISAGGPRLPRWILSFIRTRGFISVMRDVREAGAEVSQEPHAVPVR